MTLLLVSGYVVTSLCATGIVYGSLEGVVDDKQNRQQISLVIGLAWPLTVLSMFITLAGKLVSIHVLDE